MTAHFTKIVATLGPATSSPEKIKALMRAGTNVFRLNFSHGTQADHLERLKTIRSLARKNGTHYSILADMQGPKLRVGNFKNGSVTLKAGQKFRLDMASTLGDETRVALMHPEIYTVLKKGMTLLLNDGQIQLQVFKFGTDFAETKVLVGGVLSDHKGVNVPDVVLPISALTEKDKKDLAFALKIGVDWVCLSFVQKPEDVIKAQKLIDGKAGIIVKIEKPAALAHLSEIIRLADGIMVARGDLGVECPIESVPGLQREIVEACRLAGKPVIVATQMLESMIHAPVPTRAEVSDVATAVYEGADCVMLSAETATGEYPIQAVGMMKRIIEQTEADDYYGPAMDAQSLPLDKNVASAITYSMKKMVSVLDKPACIATYSISGQTTLRAARERALIPILGLTPDAKIANRMALVWGVHPVVTKSLKDMVSVSPVAVTIAKENKLVKKGEQVIMTAGIPLAEKGTTNILHIATVE